MAAVAVAIALAAAGLGVFIALRAAERREPTPFEGEPVGGGPFTCESPERLRGGSSLPALAERVAAEVLGDEASAPDAYAVAPGTGAAHLVLTTASGAEVVVDALDDPPCVRSMSSPELELTARSLTSEVDGVLEVRLHDAELRYAETMRAGVPVTAGDPVELDLPPDAWAQATLHLADGTRLHALVPT